MGTDFELFKNLSSEGLFILFYSILVLILLVLLDMLLEDLGG